jgi:hypothetical protein
MASTVLDIIQGALLNLNSYSPGESLDASTTNVGLQLLNDLFDSYSTDRDFVWSQNETQILWTPGKYQYSVGNYTAGTFVGSTQSGVLALLSATVPSNLIVGSVLTDSSGAIQAGTTVTQLGVPLNFTSGLAANSTSGFLTSIWAYPTGQVNVTFSDGEIRSATLTNGATAVTWTTGLTSAVANTATATGLVLISKAPTATVASDTFTYTIPGDIPIARPLRFRNGFTRATSSSSANLDFFFEFKSYEEYKRELLKNVPGPWPYIAAYRPDFPLGQLFVYPCPAASYTAYLYTDVIMADATNASTLFSMPQGYTRAFKKLLALEFAPILMKPVSKELRAQAKEAKDLIKALNASPPQPLTYDTAISRSETNDASWAQHGGFA